MNATVRWRNVRLCAFLLRTGYSLSRQGQSHLDRTSSVGLLMLLCGELAVAAPCLERVPFNDLGQVLACQQIEATTSIRLALYV